MHCEKVENNGVWERVLHKPETEGEEIEENQKLLELFMCSLMCLMYTILLCSRKSLIKTNLH